MGCSSGRGGYECDRGQRRCGECARHVIVAVMMKVEVKLAYLWIFGHTRVGSNFAYYRLGLLLGNHTSIIDG